MTLPEDAERRPLDPVPSTTAAGSKRTPSPGHNDTIVVLAAFLYETHPEPPL